MTSEKQLLDFVMYCTRNPHKQFWEALRDWSGYNHILASVGEELPKVSTGNVYNTAEFDERRHDEMLHEPEPLKLYTVNSTLIGRITSNPCPTKKITTQAEMDELDYAEIMRKAAARWAATNLKARFYKTKKPTGRVTKMAKAEDWWYTSIRRCGYCGSPDCKGECKDDDTASG